MFTVQRGIRAILNIALLKETNIKLLKAGIRTSCSLYRDSSAVKNDPTVSKTNLYTSRTHTCGELRLLDADKQVVLCGWLHFKRFDMFAVLRDGYGEVQIVIPNQREDLKLIMENATFESVMKVEGVVTKRPDNQINQNKPTGEIEVLISKIIILNQSESQMPFQIRNFSKAKEDLRLKYRYLDFRFPEMQHNLRFRSNFLMQVRQFLIQERNFVEVETPTLFKRTPGGAREFVVPTHEKNKFYSLVQSPQQLKQLLMVGGLDRYFQIARCYRDESTKPNRQPEFTQLDIELSFTSRESVMYLIEELLCFCLKISHQPFPQITYEDAINNYGSDKPDLRYDCKIQNLDKYISQSFPESDRTSRMLILPKGLNKITNKIIVEYQDLAKNAYNNVKLAIVKIKNMNEWAEKVEKICVGIDLDRFRKDNQININDVLILAMGKKHDALSLLGQIRTEFHKDIHSSYPPNLEDPRSFNIFWVVDFPLFLSSKNGTLESAHHPFTQPHPDDLHLLETDPLKVRGLHYDLVLNGNEIGGGSIRIHSSAQQESVFRLLNIESTDLQHMIEAFKFGCPPHGGIALGIDRLMSILCGTQTIRDVIAFPKGFGGKDLLSGAPRDISKEEKEYYHLT